MEGRHTLDSPLLQAVSGAGGLPESTGREQFVMSLGGTHHQKVTSSVVLSSRWELRDIVLS